MIADKINMTLDDIIELIKGDKSGEAQGRNTRNVKKKKNPKRLSNMTVKEHPVPLLSSSQGVKKSPLLNALNSKLLESSKEIIPAEYKLVKTVNGVERVLVPATDYLTNPILKFLSRNLNKEYPSCSSCSEYSDMPPPLIAAPIYKSPQQPVVNSMAMDGPEDEIVVLDSPNSNRNSLEVIDVESNLPVDVVEMRKLFMPGVGMMAGSGLKTLNDRFTMLTGNFGF